MVKELFPVGTMVKNKNNGRVGAVVFDPFIGETDGKIPVEYDGEENSLRILMEETEALVSLGKITAKVDFRKCGNCIFYNGSCLRYSYGRAGMLFGNGGKKRIPARIYPHCQS